MAEIELKQAIRQAIVNFSSANTHEAALDLFDTLGYNTERRNPFGQKTFAFFKESFLDGDSRFNEEKALTGEWKSVDLLFQLTSHEISTQNKPFDTKRVDNTIIETYLFFSIELEGTEYSRGRLAGITREINKVFPMPALLVFKHGQHITLSVINRRLNKKDQQKDVLDKVTVIKDISVVSPHRAHIEILFDLSFDELLRVHKFSNFVELHNAWRKTLDSKELNKRFYRDLSNWYFWALHEVRFPANSLYQADRGTLLAEDEKVKEHNAKNLIRLLTRLLFVWFVKEKDLIPDELFDETYIKENLLSGFGPRKNKGFDHKTRESKYYRAILQNLFFATLNQTVGKREFRKPGQQMNVTNLMRYENYFKNPQAFIKLMEEVVPFMNGGLFECLDIPDPTLKGKRGGDVIIYEDGFSDREDNKLCVPDYIFFGAGEHADLSEELGDKKRKDVSVNGLINILKSYKFTIAENTPIEEDVALDPELLGRVFENLLASYNPETKTTARKQTGSFYTPREIVNYMVDESLKAYLKQKLETEAAMKPEDAEAGLELLIGYNEKEHLFDAKQTAVLINAIDNCKILDPACGSGAFPMGILHKLVHILHKLDPQNKLWKERQIEKTRAIDDPDIRDNTIADIEAAFDNNELDYGRKLYLIENCIYGVDIQPIATQISKLRFFISLIVDQNADKTKDNFGIRPLPNLETKFVAANTLIGLEKPNGFLRDIELDKIEEKLKGVRHRLFSARTPATKRKLREEDQRIREEMGAILEDAGWSNESARQLAGWDPYNQNASSGWFDPEWMFGVADGFDVVIGNPPYVRQEQIKEYKSVFKSSYQCFSGIADIYVYFFERGVNLLRINGMLTFITSNKYMRAGYGEKLRHFLNESTAIHELIDFGDAPVFEATSYPCIIRLQKTNNKTNQVKALSWKREIPLEEFEFRTRANGFLISQKSLTADGWRVETPEVLRLLDKLRHAGQPLDKYVDGRFYRGVLTGLNEAFVVDRATRDRLIAEHPSSAEVLKPFLRGRDVKRWRLEPKDLWLIFTRRGIDIKKYPAILEYLTPFKKQLSPGITGGRKPGCYKWYEIQDNIAYWQEFEQPKIIYPNICKQNEFAWDDKQYYTNQKAFIIPRSSKYLLAIMNSKVVFWLFGKLLSKLQHDFYEPSSIFMKDFPVPTDCDTRPLEIIVNRILEIKNKNPDADVKELEREIDLLVYRLYGLTEEEIRIVEGVDK